MSRGPLENMHRMSAVQLKALLSVVCQVVDYVCTLPLGDLKPRWWGLCCATIFTSIMSIKVLDQLENLTRVWKYIEIEVPSLSFLNNLKRLSFGIYLHAKDLLFNCLRHDLAIFGWIYQNVTYFPVIIWKEEENKVNREDLRGHCFISTIVKHPIYTYITTVYGCHDLTWSVSGRPNAV